MIQPKPPSFPSLRELQSQKSVDECSSSLHPADRSWLLLPTGQVLPSQFSRLSPSPAFRRHDRMSHFTARENQRLRLHFERIRSEKRAHSRQHTVSPVVTRTPTDIDYQRLIERLQKAQSGSHGYRRLNLVEEKTESCLLDQEEVQYMRVAVGGKPCPLRVMFSRNRGRLVVYVSRTVAEPSETLSDMTIYKDTLKISDPGSKFHTEVVYLGVKALTDSAFTVKVQFGVSDLQRMDTTRSKDRQHRSQEEILWEEWENSAHSHSPSYSVNYVKHNQVILPPDSPVRKAAEQLRKQQYSHRRVTVVHKKQTIMEEKRKKTYIEVHRKEIRMMELEQKRAIQRLHAKKVTSEQDFFRIIYYAKGLTSLWVKFKDLKGEKGRKAVEEKAATQLQARVRGYLWGVGRLGVTVRQGRNVLLMYVKMSSEYYVHSVQTQLFTLITASCELSLIPKAIKHLRVHGNFHSVVTIQRRWRLYTQRQVEYFLQLEKFWTAQVEFLLNSKRIKKKKEVFAGLMSISAEEKAKELRKLQANHRFLYKNALKEYRKEQKELELQGPRGFFEAMRVKGEPLAVCPQQYGLPSKEDVRERLEKAAKQALKSLSM